MPVTVTIEGIPELRRKWRRAIAELEAGMRGATLDAAGAGVTAAQNDHPYQDHRDPQKSARWKGAIGLTDTSHAEQNRIGSQAQGFEAEMVWPADYGSFVDEGTSRSRPYPFTPVAVEVANKKLGEGAERAVQNFLRSVG